MFDVANAAANADVIVGFESDRDRVEPDRDKHERPPLGLGALTDADLAIGARRPGSGWPTTRRRAGSPTTATARARRRPGR